MGSFRMFRVKDKDSLNYGVFKTADNAKGFRRSGEPKMDLVVAGGSVHVHKSLVGEAEEIQVSWKDEEITDDKKTEGTKSKPERTKK